MNKKILLSSISLSIIAGCSSTPAINESVSKEIQSQINSIKLNGALVKQQDGFVIAPTLTPSKTESKGMLYTDQWSFDGKTLFPSFKSQRFECKVKNEDCAGYEQIASPFVKVNATESDYGDTYAKRVADGKAPGMSAKDIAMTGASAILVGPAVALVAGPIVLLGGAANLVTHGSVWTTKWVEFDHDDFYEQTANAIRAKHGSLDNYISYMASASAAYDNLTQYSDNLHSELRTLKQQKSNDIKRYHHTELTDINRYTIEMPSYGDIQTINTAIQSDIQTYYVNSQASLLAEYNTKLNEAKSLYIKQQKTDYANANTSSQMEYFISKYSKLDEAKLIVKAKVKLDTLIKQEQATEFKKISSYSDAHYFIAKYKNSDKAQLVPKARKLWSKLVKKEQTAAFNKLKTIADAKKFIYDYERIDEAKLVAKARDMVAKEESRIANAKIERRKRAKAKLDQWRKNLKVGDQTFCGRVIEANYPMFHIAISNPLQGFSNTIWLEKDRVFEAYSGCRNVNNQLTPYTNPLS